MNDALLSKIIAAVKWSVLAELASKVISPLVFVILARVLSPSDYGVVAVATIVISFSQVFWEAGLAKALIQTEDQHEEAADVVFWTNIFLGLAIYQILYFSAGWIAQLFNDIETIAVIRIQGTQIIIASFCSVQTALYQRQLEFKKIFWVRLITSAVPGIASIPLALLGHGYWALVGGTLIGAFAQLIILWVGSPWRPRLQYNWRKAREMIGFGVWVMGEGLLGWFYIWADSLIVGAYLGSKELGLYRVGNSFVQMIFGFVLSPLLPVLFSMFSRIQTDVVLLRKTLRMVSKIIALIALPVGFGLFVLANPIAQVVFGIQWDGVAEVISLLGITHGIAWLVGANSEVYRAIGRPDLNVKIMLSALTVYCLAYLWAAPQGISVFLWARFSVMIITLSMHFLVLKKYMGVSVYSIFIDYRWIFFASGIMTFSSWLLLEFFFMGAPEIAALIIVTCFGSLIYVLFLYPEIIFVKKIFNVLVSRNNNT